jgi:hypothetical protein
MEYHKHKGIQYSTGILKSHPINSNHKDEKTRYEHNRTLTNKQKKYYQPTEKNKESLIKKSVDVTNNKKDNIICIQKDNDGYLSLDLDKCDCNGVKITFSRKEGNTNRQVGLKIDNKPANNINQNNLNEDYYDEK